MYEQATLLDNATDGIIVINTEGKVTYWSKGAGRMYGMEIDGALGEPLTSAIGVSPSENFEAFRKTLDEGSWEGEMNNVTKDQRSITVNSRWTLLRSGPNTPRSILIVNSDITEKKILQKQFYRSQRLDSLGTLAGGIAHDLNNVLAPILLSFEVLSRHVKEESGKKMLKTAQESANRGKQIVSQVLTFARGIEGKKGSIQVRHLLDEIANIVRETFPKSIEMRTEIPKTLWPIFADAGQMHQVMMNLAVNARDAMLHGGKLTLAARNAELDEHFCRMQLKAVPGRYVVLSVEDTGVGIPASILDRIFDPFFTTKEMGKGTGLGLSTVHTIVNSHNGFIDVTSTLGKGTTFKIYIPSAREESEEQKSESPVETTMGHGEWILVIDDERPIRDITEQVLLNRGYNVMTAGDGVEAVALFAERSGRFDLVLTDLMMPLMDGVATIRALRRIRPEIKIIAMSGAMTDDSAMQAKDLSPESFLSKPFTSEVLLHTIGGVLKKS
jgi:PAS domain S-box-containing protein